MVTTRTESTTETNAVVALATGNFPSVNAVCIVKYRTKPMASTIKPMMTVMPPNSLTYGGTGVDEGFFKADIANSWTRATPVHAMAKLVLTYARNVLSDAK